MFQNIKNSIQQKYQDTVASITAPPDEPQFMKNGMLSTKEFIESAEKLIQVSPEWKWMQAYSDKFLYKYLPQDKQYLILNRIPCEQRIKEMLQDTEQNMKESEDEEGWTLSINTKFQNNNKQEDKIEIKEDHFENNEEQKTEDDNSKPIIVEQPFDVRYYDISICYDPYHYCPRLFLTAVDENDQPIKPEDIWDIFIKSIQQKLIKPSISDIFSQSKKQFFQYQIFFANKFLKCPIFEDIAAEKINQTVTIESHPATGIKQVDYCSFKYIKASIHPCKHAKILRQLTEQIQEDRGNVVGPHLALLIFLKFFHDVVPTIQIDTSFDIALS